MISKIFINLSVKDLSKSINFFTSLGFKFNSQFTDETATCMIISDSIFVMLLTEDKFQSFSPNSICDTKKNTEVLNALQVASREQVDLMISRAVLAGGKTYNQPQDHGFMYAHGFQDLDHHVWEVFYMDETMIPRQE